MNKMTFSFKLVAAITAVAILQACANMAVKTQCATPKLDPDGGAVT